MIVCTVESLEKFRGPPWDLLGTSDIGHILAWDKEASEQMVFDKRRKFSRSDIFVTNW